MSGPNTESLWRFEQTVDLGRWRYRIEIGPRWPSRIGFGKGPAGWHYASRWIRVELFRPGAIAKSVPGR